MWNYEWIRNGAGISLMVPKGHIWRAYNVVMRKGITGICWQEKKKNTEFVSDGPLILFLTLDKI